MSDDSTAVRTYAFACVTLATLCLAGGTAVYLACRPRQPVLFTALGIGAAPFVSQCNSFPAHQWLPTFAHVAAFSFASCALLSPRPRSVFVAAGCWSLLNIGWELRSIAGQTSDARDAVAAVSAFVAVSCVVTLMQRVFVHARHTGSET